MRLSVDEYRQNLEPLLLAGDAEVDPHRAFALVAFSFLTEPSDLLPQLLAEWIAVEQLLDLVILRADSSAVGALLPSEAIEFIEHKLGSNLGLIWANALERWVPRLNRRDLLASLAWMAAGRSGLDAPHRIILEGTDAYPLGFEDLRAHRPGVVWCVGDASLLAKPGSLSVVGTRQASRYGAGVAADVAAVAAQAGVVTVSGGAFGIDSIVHESAVKLESPTIALMAGGLGHLYPRSNASLFESIVKNGLVASEVAPFVTPAKWRFLMRNRLIAALGNATIVVEAGKTSGALNTARTAVELGREVAIVPGPIDSSRSIGCHDLLNDCLGQVKILSRPQDALKLLGLGSYELAAARGMGALEVRALDAFGVGYVETWEVQRLAGLTSRETQIALGSLELAGLIERQGTGYRRTDG